MIYGLICLCLSLAGVAGLQFFYMVYLERACNQHKKRVILLERRLKSLGERLTETQASLADRNDMIEAIYEDQDDAQHEIWADVIEER